MTEGGSLFPYCCSRQGMARRDRKGRCRFWALALLWLPAVVVAQAIVRFGADFGPPAEPGMWLATVPMMEVSLLPVENSGRGDSSTRSSTRASFGSVARGFSVGQIFLQCGLDAETARARRRSGRLAFVPCRVRVSRLPPGSTSG